MRMNRILKIVLFAPLFLILFALFTYLVMRLWNWLMPPLFACQ